MIKLSKLKKIFAYLTLASTVGSLIISLWVGKEWFWTAIAASWILIAISEMSSEKKPS